MTPRISFDEYYVKNLNEYNSIIQTLIDDHKELYFRGEGNSDYKMSPSISRDLPPNFDVKDEENLYKAFERNMALYRHETYREYTNVAGLNKFETIAIGQHNGLKTRFLDWSTNPLTSLYFACEDAPQAKKTKPTNEYCRISVLVAPEDRGERNKYFYNVADEIPNYNDIVNGDTTKMYVPTIVNPRIKNQSGLFAVIHFDKKSNKYVPFEENDAFWDYKIKGQPYDKTKHWNLIKILINKVLHGEEILHNLRRFDIHRESVYPGLENLTKRLGYDYQQGFVI